MTILLSILVILLLIYIVYEKRKTHRELSEFTEAIIYKDFTRKYPEKGIRKRTHQQFNLLTHAFLKLSGEKEAQQSYLKEMLELVDTGILAYNTDTLDILWMNDSFTSMLNIPRLKSLKWLEKQNENLFNEIANIPLDRNRLLTIHGQKQTIRTMTKASLLHSDGKSYKLIAFHNVSSTMEEVESGAWKGLLNVMTHEIMNSIIPVTSLSDTLIKKLETNKELPASSLAPDFKDMENALETIHRRSQGLLRFAENYRNLSQKITPNIATHNLYDLLRSIFALMNPSMQQKGITLTLQTEHPETTAEIDRDLIEQVVINFITNATFAIRNESEPQIHLFSGKDSEGISFITVADNGQGIPDDIRERIFIPFFSTKKNGNGIGLSISREIVKLHQGHIHIQSKENEGSAFTILF